MKKRSLTGIALLVSSTLLAFFVWPGIFSNESGASTEKIIQKTGAWESMQFINTARAYPEQDIPPGAYTEANLFYKNNFGAQESRSRITASSWYSLGPTNIGGRTLSIAIDPFDSDIVWLGSASGGLWKSTTGGLGANAWSYVPTGYPVLGISCIAMPPNNPSVMYIGTGETYSYGTSVNGLLERPTRGSVGMGILKSTDGGNTWSPSLDWQYQQKRGVWDIQINPLDPNIVYAATTEGIYKTSDAGANWTQVFHEIMVMDLLLDPLDTNYIYAGVGNAGSPNSGIYRSSDGGTNWTRLSAGLPPTGNTGRITLDINKQNHNSLIALVADLYSTIGIYNSRDKGNTWTPINGLTEIVSYQGWYSKGLYMSDIDSNWVYFGGVWLFKSEMNGDFPNLLANTYDVHADIHDIVSSAYDPGRLYILTDGGLYRSDNFGNTFYPCTDGYVTSQAYIGSVSHQDENIMLAGLQDNGTVLYTGSPYWEPVIGGDGAFNAIDPNTDQVMYGSYQYLNLVKSWDQGFTFHDILDHPASSFGGNNVAFVAPLALSPSNSSILYAACDSMHRSNDGGDNWYFTNNDLLDGGNVALCIAVSSTNPDSIYVATAPGDLRPMHVQRSGDGGSSFTDISNGLPNRYPRDITVDPRDSRIVYVAFSGFGAGHLFKSVDSGSNWTDISTSLPDIPFHCITLDELHPDTVFAGSDLGAFVSVDAGISWDGLNLGLPSGVMVFDLVYSSFDHSLVAFTHGNGVYRNNLISLPVGISAASAQTSFELNLINNSVRDWLHFRINASGSMHCSIYDSEGKIVHDESLEHSNESTEEFYLSKLSPGIYFLSVENRGRIQTRKFIKI